MGRLAVILGSSALGPGGEEIAAAAAEHGAAISQRHGGVGGTFALPHLIDHEANLRPLAEQGCDRVLAISSVGSLRAEIPVGTLVCPEDFIALNQAGSIFVDARAHSAPGFEPRWRREVVEAWTEAGAAPYDGGVYWQAAGPRFETPAEIRLMAAHAEVVGMTVGSECVVAGELGLEYAALCMVDNLANGLGAARLGIEEIELDRVANAAKLRDGLAAVLPLLGAVGR
jgi:5'-methylthioadenosine phosphorylase